MTSPYVYFEDQLAASGPWKQRYYESPVEIITAWGAKDVAPALARLQSHRDNGHFLAGYFSYELGYLLEDSLVDLLPKNRDTPLIQFGAFQTYEHKDLPNAGRAEIGWMKPDWTKSQYKKRFEKVAAYIEAGDVYQINLTFALRGRAKGTAAALYNFLKKRQPVHYGGVVQLDECPAITLSPELFYEQNQHQIFMRPMKGTIKRGATDYEDIELSNALQADTKNKAENLMIVDLLRNDLSRISEPGSVNVSDLFSIETYPSLHTMTSGIEAQLKPNIGLDQILRALFPCGSVTGAPKIRAMEIIRELESVPRNAYCGAIGMIDPDGASRFNVGIRTLSLSKNGELVYPVGSGVVADSTGGSEYEECLLKAAFLTGGPFELIETIGWDPVVGFMHLDLHLERLAASAFVFGYAFNKIRVHKMLNKAVLGLNRPHKVRMTLSSKGEVQTQSTALDFSDPSVPWPVALSKNKLNSRDRMLRHKTSQRQFYDSERDRIEKITGCKEALFFNERDELCEGSFTNIFVRKQGKLVTPPLKSGLLPGILRKTLLANDEASTGILTHADLKQANEIFVGNSVRGLIRAHLIDFDLH